MAKRPRPSKPSTDAKKSGPPAHTDPQWADFWGSRGWVAPDVSAWSDPFQDRRLFLYASSLRDKFGFVRFVGIPTQGGPEATPMAALFVEPALSGERIDPNRPPKDWPVSAALIDAVIANPRLVVLGDPGSGKSTLTSWLVLSLLSREKNRLKDAVGPLLPVTLVLRDLDIAGVVTWEKLLSRLVAHPSGQALGSPGAIEGFLRSGQAMVLVDGLDEAGGTSTRLAVVAALHTAFDRYPSVRWVITSRVVGYDETPVESSLIAGEEPRRSLMTVVQDAAYEELARVSRVASNPFVPAKAEQVQKRGPQVRPVAARLYVTPFDDARIAMFVRNWHEQHEPDRAERSVRSAELIEAIDRSPQVKGLARTPNLLTMIALVYRVDLRLPDGRALLYERIAQAYLETIETARKLPTPGHTLEDMKRWLGYAAFQMQRARFAPDAENQEDHGILISRGDLIQHIVFGMAKGNVAAFDQQRPTAEAFVDWVARRAGLIIPRSEELFAFAHLSFQEYFAAWFIAEQITGPSWNKLGRTPSPLAAGTDLTTLKAATGDVRWHESFVLLFELLAVRGEWADEVLELLFDPADDLAWPTPEFEARTYDAATARERLLVMLARDRHSGLATESRALAFRRAWLSLDAAGRRMHEKSSYLKTELARRLLEPDSGLISPALAVLGASPAPLVLEVLPLVDYVTDEVAQVLSEASEALGLAKVLLIASPQLTDEGVQRLIGPNTSLKQLNVLGLYHVLLTDVGAVALAAKHSGLAKLTTLELHRTHVGDVGAAALAAKDSILKGLTTLSLHGTEISDAGAAALAAEDSGLKVLTALDLGGTQITDAGAAALAARNSGLKSLTTLNLSDTRITDAGAAALAARNSGLKSLTRLDLTDTRITDAGVKAILDRYPGIAISR
jgi:hypothetical protein